MANFSELLEPRFGRAPSWDARRFIAPCLACRTVEGRTDHAGPRLWVMTSTFVLLMAAWLWEIVALDAHATTAARESASDGGGPSERAVVSCLALREPKVGSAVGGVCRRESRLHAGTSRQPGRSSQSLPSRTYCE